VRIDLLGTIVTISGLIFFTVSLAIIILGKKVGDGARGVQKIRLGHSLEVAANSVLTLVLITACFSLATLALTYWKPDLSEYVEKKEVDKNYLALKDVSITILGSVVLEGGGTANDAKIEIRHGSSIITDSETDEQGFFSIVLSPAKPNEDYTIIWSKKGYAKKKLRFGLNQIVYPVTLARGEEN
jgi:hypothetical protein